MPALLYMCALVMCVCDLSSLLTHTPAAQDSQGGPRGSAPSSNSRSAISIEPQAGSFQNTATEMALSPGESWAESDGRNAATRLLANMQATTRVSHASWFLDSHARVSSHEAR